MSSTTGLRAGDLLSELARIRTLLDRHRNRARRLERSRDYWRTRARTAEADLSAHRIWNQRTKGAKP